MHQCGCLIHSKQQQLHCVPHLTIRKALTAGSQEALLTECMMQVPVHIVTNKLTFGIARAPDTPTSYLTYPDDTGYRGGGERTCAYSGLGSRLKFTV